MIVSTPVTFAEAVALLQKKKLLPTTLSSADLEKLAAEFKRQAFFSARTTNADFLQRAADLVERIVDPRKTGGEAGTYMDVPRFREELKNFLQSIGYSAEDGKAGTIQDLSSDARLNLIAKTNTQLAQGYGQFVQANDADVLDAFPAQELFRLEQREKPRDWILRWRGAGGRTYGGRMVALKDDEVWTGISRFGNPYPPYDYNSGMWTLPVSRSDAVALGVIDADRKVKPQEAGFATTLQAGIAGLSGALQQILVAGIPGASIDGDTISVAGGD
ncbi:MAG: hypothetical protein V1929_00350 [bacterium]